MNSAAIVEPQERLAAPFAPQILTYALVTPARNEAALIEQTIRSVIAQTALPRRWIIVSDGSTDGTDEIVQRYAREHDWIELLRMPERSDRQFAAKAHAFNAGYARLAGVPFDIIGNLDADITFEPDYFSFLLSKFQLSPELGVAGTPFVEDHERLDQHSYAHQFANSTHVSGGCQMFRQKCFAEIGGYIPVKVGAIDWIAVTTARMKGWQTRTFTEKVCFHHRKLGVGSGSHGKLRMRFHYGYKAYHVGGHPLWECLRGLFQMRQRPFVLGGVWFIAGYIWAALHRSERAVSPELMRFHRAEQMARLRAGWKRILVGSNNEFSAPGRSIKMKKGMALIIADKEIAVAGKFFRTAKLRHEWCDFLDDAPATVEQMQRGRHLADLFTFVHDICDDPVTYRFYKETASLAVLRITTYQQWWDDMGFKARNKVRKGQKSGVELRLVHLDNDFAKGVERIYNETPVKQGRGFYHYGKKAREIKEELSSFLDRCFLVGAYYQNELVGFMKLFHGENVLRTIHIIAKIAHRDKCVMDALIAKAVKLCDQNGVEYLHYGSWSGGGIGDFRTKHGFRRIEVPRYFVPLTTRGKLMLKLKLHHSIRERLPERLVRPLMALRTRLNSIRYRPSKAKHLPIAEINLRRGG